MIPWNFEADQIIVSDEISMSEIVFNEGIDEYLKLKTNKSNKLFLIAPKGLGKTLILKTKSVQFRKENSSFVFIPENELCEKISISNFSISAENFVQFGELDVWLRIWKQTLCLTLLKQLELPIPVVINSKLGKAKEMSELLNIIIQDKIFFIFKEGWRLIDSEILPQIRGLNRQVAIFIDSLDQAIGQLIRTQKFGFNNSVDEEKAIKVWSNAQLGLMHASHQLSVQNKHIKIFATIREEAFELDESDINLQIKDYSVFIKYTKNELREIFISNINKTSSEKLVDIDHPDPFIRFLGTNHLPHSFVIDIEEDIFDFMYRHTFGRPRELVLLGKRIYELRKEERTIDIIRRKVNIVSHEEIFTQFKKEIVPSFNDQRLSDFCKKLKYNVFTNLEAAKLNQDDLSFYYKIGLIGRAKLIHNQDLYVQEFNTAHKFNYKKFHLVPKAKWYFTHPAMDGFLIDILKKKYNKTNIIGYDRPFKIPNGISLDKQVRKVEKPIKLKKKINNGVINVFIASPTDVNPNIRNKLINNLETDFRKSGFENLCEHRIITKSWEELPSQPGYAQDLITSKLLRASEVVIVVFKYKLGTPTMDINTGKERSLSGTVEELLTSLTSARKKRKVVSVYFPVKGPTINASDKDSLKILQEWEKLQEFISNIKEKILFKRYSSDTLLYKTIIEDLKNNIQNIYGNA